MTQPATLDRHRGLLHLLGPEWLASNVARLTDTDLARLEAHFAEHPELFEPGPVTTLVNRALDDTGAVADGQAFAELTALADGAGR
jgi:hypothetical protein